MSATYLLGARTFSFGYIAPTKALVVEAIIMRAIGEPLFKAFMDSKKSGADKATMEAAGAAAIGLMASRINADDLATIVNTVFEYVCVDGSRVIVDQHFVGKPRELWMVLVEALKFNFSDFFSGGLFSSMLPTPTT